MSEAFIPCPPLMVGSSLQQLLEGCMSPCLLLSLPLPGCRALLWAVSVWMGKKEVSHETYMDRITSCKSKYVTVEWSAYRFLCTLVLKCSFKDLISTKYLLQNKKSHHIKIKSIFLKNLTDEQLTAWESIRRGHFILRKPWGSGTLD